MSRLMSGLIAILLAALMSFATACGTAHANDEPFNNPDPTRLPTPIPTPDRLVSWQVSGSAFCARGCTAPAVWTTAGRADDLRLREAVFIIWTYVPELRPVIDHDGRAGVYLTVGPTGDPDAGGIYNPLTQGVTMSPGSARLQIAVLASMVAHELVHGTQDHSRAGMGCQREVDAYSWEAFTWQRLRSSAGISTTLDEITQAWQQGWLERLVRSWPLYRGVCS